MLFRSAVSWANSVIYRRMLSERRVLGASVRRWGRKLLAVALVEVLALTSVFAVAGSPGVPAGDQYAGVLAMQRSASFMNRNAAFQPNENRSAHSVSSSEKVARLVRPKFPVPPVRPALQNVAPNIAVSVGFADNSSPSPNFPVPWQSSPNTVFLGGGNSIRAGAVRLDNTGASDITVDSVTVDLGRPGPAFQLWTNFVVPANGSVILTQTAENNFNTSAASPILTCGQTLADGETRIPTIKVTIAGSDTKFSDTAHVLDTGGFDSSCRGNQSLAWRPIGSTGPERPTASLHLFSENAPHDVATSTTFTATLTDAADQPLANAPVSLTVLNGPNQGKSANGTTDANGAANIQYAGSTQGVDLAQASIANASTGTLNSESASTVWTSAGACTTPAAQPGTAQLIYVGQTSGSFGNQLRVAALLTDGNGQPLANRALAFNIGGVPVTANTAANGVASTTFQPNIGQTAVSIAFAGDSNFSAAQLTTSITIQPKATLLRYTGNTLLGSTGTQSVSAVLTDSLGLTPIANRTVTFSVGTTQASAVTDATGTASATITFPANQASGPAQLAISFAGDADYNPSSRVVPIQIYLTTSFVVWGGNTGGLKVGQDVNFWGDQWSSQVTGGNFTANASFKGFADPIGPIQQCQPNATNATLAQGCWQSKPGNSSPPPLSLPAYVQIIVSTAITKSGATIFGNIACAAVLKVDATPAYAPDPSHPGFGVITAVNGDCAGVFPKPAVLTAKQTQPTPVLPSQQVSVNVAIQNSGATNATNATLSESFDGLIPSSASQNFATIVAGQGANASFPTSVPATPARQSTETSSDYLTRLAGLDGRLFTASGELSFTDVFQQLYQPLDFSSFSTLQIPRLTVGVSGPACIVPGSQVPYQISINNIGNGTATQGSTTVTLPDGTSQSVPVPQILPAASFASTVQWKAPVVQPKDPAETTAAYLSRLTAADNVTVPATTASVNWSDALNNAYGAVAEQFASVKQRLPILALTPSAPATVLPNQAATANFTVTNSGGGSAVQATIAIKRSGAPDITVPGFSVPAGTTANPSGILRFPLATAKGAQETDAQYLTRLQTVDNQQFSLDANLSWTDKSGNLYGPTSNPFSTTEILPILTFAASGPATANAGDTIAYTVAVQNNGHADASALNITVTLPDGTVRHPLAGTSVPAGGTVQTTVNFTIPANQPAGAMNATFTLHWSDAAGNSYGAESATATTTVGTQGATITDFNPKTGPSGTAVAIVGTNLSVPAGPTTVTFAGPNNTRLTARINFASAGQVAAVVPDNAVTGLIQLSNPAGSASSAVPFTVAARQDFSVTASPSTATVPQGSTTAFVIAVTSPQTTFTQMATLSAAGLPQGVAAGFAPPQIPAGASSTLSIDLSATNLQPGTYPFVIHATTTIDGKQQDRTANANLNVIAANQTTLAGQVLSTSNEPIIGASVSLDGQTVLTDSAGRFILIGIQAGTNRPLSIDGHSAFSPNATFPLIFEPANVVAGRANVIGAAFHLPPIDTAQEITIDPTRDTIAGNAAVPNLQMTVPKGANLRMLDGSLVTRTSITPLAPDRTPAPLPSTVGTNIVYTSQPGGAITDIPIPVVYPNVAGLDPNTRVELWAFDHAHVNWFIYGFGRVSTDGRTIAPEIDPTTGKPYGLKDFSWHFPNTGPNGNPSDPNSCPKSQGANPVDFSTGMKLERVPQVSWGGARGGLTFSLIYTTDKAQNCDNCPFGRGWTHNWDIKLNGSFAAGGAGRLVMPDQVAGRLFSSSGTDSSGAPRFTTTATTTQLGAAMVVRPSVTSYTDPDGTTLNFDTSGRLVSRVDKNGNATTLSYSSGRLSKITDPVGRSLTFTYDGSGRISSMTDPLNRTWHYTFEGTPGVAGLPGLTTITDPAGNVTKYTYVTGGRVAAVTDPRGNVVKQITYDPNGRVATQTFADGGTESYNYSLSGTIVTSTAITDVRGKTQTKRFNANGYVIGITDAAGQTATIQRDLTTNVAVSIVGACGCTQHARTFTAAGDVSSSGGAVGGVMLRNYEPTFHVVTTQTDPQGHVTSYTYDQNGNLLSKTDALNQTTTYQNDAHGELTTIIDPSGASSHLEYDAFGNISAASNPGGARTTFEYDLLGHTTAVTDAMGRRTAMQYDLRDRVSNITDPAGNITRYTYDASGNRTGIINPLGKKWTYAYDARNRLISRTDPLGHTRSYTYDAGNHVIVVKSAMGRISQFTYTERGQKATRIRPNGETIQYTYDANGNLVKLTDARGNSISYSYDAGNRLVSRTDPLGRTASVSYDLDGNIIQKIDRFGRQTNFTYDALNRVTRVNYPDAEVSYVYDALGHIVQKSDSAGGTIKWDFDSNGRLTSETTAKAAVDYAYNLAGQITSLGVRGKPAVLYQYDDFGRLVSIANGSKSFTFQYDAASRRTQLVRSNGITTTYGYDDANRLTRITHSGLGGVLEDMIYAFDDDGRIISRQSAVDHNLLPASTTVGTADPGNRIPQFGANSLSYDDEGQLLGVNGPQKATTYHWDARGRLIGADLQNGNSVQYSYDATGRLASKKLNGAQTDYVYSGGAILSRTDSLGNELNFVNGPADSERLAQSGGNGDLYLLQDHAGSIISISGANGAPVEQESYEPFGNGPGSALTEFGFIGQRFDSDTGLLNLNSRFYDPSLQRFITEDPIGVLGGLNTYAYSENDPINRFDPSGLMSWDDFLYQAAQFSAGAGDKLSFGLTNWIRDKMGINDVIDKCSMAYQIGGYTGDVINYSIQALSLAGPLLEAGAAAAEALEAAEAIETEASLAADAEAVAEQAASDAEELEAACGLCFPAGTPVLTRNGPVPVEKVKVGDEVLSRNRTTGLLEYKQVTGLVEPHLSKLIEVRVAGEAYALTPTPEHPFFIKRASGGEWVPASQIHAGDLVLTQSGTWSEITSVSPIDGQAPVYNFEVQENHDYFVGSTGILVHNGCAPSSRELGENLEDAGVDRPPDSAAHHIVAGSDARAEEAREILENEGIGINDADNGVFLPKNSSVPNPEGAQVHSTLHTDSYYDAVNQALQNAAPGTVRDVLSSIANQLLNGTFPH